MARRRGAQLVLGGVLLLSNSASAAPATPPSVPVLAAADVLTGGVHSAVQVAPRAVTVQPAASTTTRVLPPVPMMLSRSGIPARALAAYQAAAQRAAGSGCRLSWPLLAGIGFVESGHGSVHDGAVGADGRVLPPILGPRLDGSGAFALISDSDGGRIDGDPQLDRAVGPMQFIPSTWARHGKDGDGNGVADPHDLDDAALAAGGYLCTTSRQLDRPRSLIAAVFSYNHSYDYVRVVLTAAARYAGESPQQWGVGLLPAPVDPTPGTTSEPSAVPTPGSAAATAPAQDAGAPPDAGEPAPAEPEPTAAGEPAPAAPAPVPEPEPEPEPEPTQEPTQEPSQEAPAEPEPEPTGDPGRR